MKMKFKITPAAQGPESMTIASDDGSRISIVGTKNDLASLALSLNGTWEVCETSWTTEPTYYSNSEYRELPIKDMDSTHIARAMLKLLRNATFRSQGVSDWEMATAIARGDFSFINRYERGEEINWLAEELRKRDEEVPF